MKSLLAFTLTLILLNYVNADCNDKSTPPKWPESYTVKGILMIPYAEIREPFYAWFNGPSKQSRIDYYGDMVKTYQLSQLTTYGSSIKIAPVTNEQETNVRTCLQVNGTAENKIDPQAILPSLEGFTCQGDEIIDGVQVEKWQLETTIGDKMNKYTMWISYRSDPDGKVSIAVPRKYEMKGFNSLLGSHYDHYYLIYNDFNNDAVPPETFAIDSNLTCSSFPGPGDKHIYTFNPMKEFIHPSTDSHVDFEFDKFKTKHGKNYVNEKEHALRKDIFRQNVRYIHSVNRQSRVMKQSNMDMDCTSEGTICDNNENQVAINGYWRTNCQGLCPICKKNLDLNGFSLGVNHLSDKTDLELKALRGKQYSKGYNGGKPFPHKNFGSVKVPDSFDWRIYGAVTPVKDQSVCGSCWSFGTVGAIEGAYFLKNGGKLVRLSQQALVDCSWGYGNNGCDGGEDFRAYQWMMKHGGIPTENEYGPYLGQDGYCHADKIPKVAPITGYVNVTSGDEDALKLAIFKHGPISVAIDAGHKTFSFYSNGIYYEPTCGNKVDELDHAVLAVGYGTIAGQDYWLIKNSWSNYWGNDGYVLMSAKNNNCGVMTTPTYVTM